MDSLIDFIWEKLIYKQQVTFDHKHNNDILGSLIDYMRGRENIVPIFLTPRGKMV